MALDFQYDELLVQKKQLKNELAGGVAYGFSFEVNYPSYRGTFLSCIESLNVTVDGKQLPIGDLRFTLNGKQFLVSELPELCHEYWFVLTPATLKAMLPGGLKPGKHSVKVSMVHKVPYTGYFGQYLTLDSSASFEAAV